MRKHFALVLAFFMIFKWLTISVLSAEPEHQGVASWNQDAEGTYGHYINEFTDKDIVPEGTETISVRASDFVENNGETLKNDTENDGVVINDESGSVTWEFTVLQPGLYNIELEYRTIDDKRSDIEFSCLIDSKRPFQELGLMKLSRIWNDASQDFVKDEKGNDLRPQIVQSFDWQRDALKNTEGLYNEPFLFYFTKGVHTITLEILSQKLSLSKIQIKPYRPVVSYSEYLKKYSNLPKYEGKSLFYEAEKMAYRTSSSILAQYDMTSPYTTPYDPARLRLNTTGGTNWKYPWQRIGWNIDVPQEGLYRISIRFRQNYLAGMNVYRTLYVNGEVPFKEASALKFGYSSGWQTSNVGEYYIKLNKGKNEIALEVTMGNMTEIVRSLQKILLDMNQMYRKILMVTGVSPDRYRDYELEKEIPDLPETFRRNANALENIAQKLRTEKNVSGSEISFLMEFSRQLNDTAAKVYTLTKNNRLDKMKSNLSSLGSLISKLREQPLEIDSFCFGSDKMEMQPGNADFKAEVIHRARRFLASFISDYDSMSSGNSKRQIRVWIQNMGLDQMQIIKNMLDDDFISKKGISVKLELIQASVIQAVFAGKGPDVAINCSDSEPVNYAMRGILYDLSDFSDFEEVTEQFMRDSLIPFRYEKGYYALPEKQSFNMMFYRKDIFEDLELKPPATWTELISKVLPVVKRNNMEIGIGTLSSIQNMESYNIFTTLLYQMGGRLYSNDLKSTNLNTIEAFTSFQQAVSLYKEYKFPQEYDSMNRFRTGEMPLVIANYTFSNNLAIGAPELAGLWEMLPIPGTADDTGKINRAQLFTATGAILFNKSNDVLAGWEFLKWWTGAEAQTRFGLEQEAVLGASGRYNPANIHAIRNLPWNSKQLKQLELQRNECLAVPQLPGSYFTAKAVNNAFLSCVLSNRIPREELLYWSDEIDIELERKRKEFNFQPGVYE